MVVVCNMTPVPRLGFRLGLPQAEGQQGGGWREVLNSDSEYYGGSNLGNSGTALAVQHAPAQGHAHSITLNVPPLASLFLVRD